MTQPPTLTIRCEACGAPMTIRENHETKSRFLGCSTFPECRETQPLPAYYVMLEAGAAQLPGMERL